MSENRKASTNVRRRLANRFSKKGKKSRKARFLNNPMTGHDFESKTAIKCQDPYYDINTRDLKNAMDLSQELGKPKYKNNPVKNWNLQKGKILPCKDDDYVRLVDDNFCCDPAEHRSDNPLSNDPDYDRKLEERKQAYLDLFEEEGGISEASMRRNTLPLTEKLYDELTLPHAPEKLAIMHNGRAGVIPKSQLQQFKDYYLSQKTLIDLSAITRESKEVVKHLARFVAHGAAPNDPKTIRGKRGLKIKPPRGKALDPEERVKYTGKAAKQAFNNAGKLHEELLANNAKMAELQQVVIQEYGSGQKAVIEGRKKKSRAKIQGRKVNAKVNGRKSSIKRKGKRPGHKVKGRKPNSKAKGRGKGKGRGK